jgi:hypothetical protein
MKKMPQYTLVLEGQRAYAILLDKNICGGAADGSFKYDLEITASKLDAQGFVIDNVVRELIAKEWNDTTYIASCEQLAGGLVNYIRADMGTRLASVVARVYNKTGYAEIVWTKGQEAPVGPRKATQKEKNAERNTYRTKSAC